MTTYLLISAITFLILGLLWKKNDFINFLVKVFLVIMAIAGAILWFEAKGFVFRK